MKKVQFEIYVGKETVDTIEMYVSEYYAKHGYPDYNINPNADYTIMDEILKNHPNATGWKMVGVEDRLQPRS